MRRTALLLVVAGATLIASCGSDTVSLRYRPRAGSVTTYETSSTARTHSDVPGRAPDVEQSSHLIIRHRVLSTGQVAVVLVEGQYLDVTQNGFAVPAPEPISITFQVDSAGRALELTTETMNPTDEARQGLPEITGPFPSEPVRPGQEWTFPAPVGRSGFGGTARLVRLGHRHGMPVAEIDATLRTTIEETELRGRDGPVTIGGSLLLVLHGVYEVATGVLVESRQELTGEFRLRFTLEGSNTPPVAGSQRLTVHTDTRRAGTTPGPRA